MAWLKELVLRFIVPLDKESLNSWLYLMEIGNITITVVFLLTFTMALLSSELLLLLKFGMIAITLLIFLSVSTILQYLLIIEFNTRSRDLKKRGLYTMG